MRVNVQLIDAETGNNTFWAERFDKPLADLFDMQDEIVARLAGALNAQLTAAEARRAEQAPTPDSMDPYFRVRLGSTRVLPPIMWCTRAAFSIARCPPIPTTSTRWWSGSCGLPRGLIFLGGPSDGGLARRSEVDQSLVLGPRSCARHMLFGMSTYFPGARAGHRQCEHALALDRNLAQAHSFIGRGKIFVGRAEETETHCRGPAPQSARYGSLHLDDARGRGEASPRQLGARSRVAPAGDRGQSKFSASIFFVGRRPHAEWST